jgi:hypothetical protein
MIKIINPGKVPVRGLEQKHNMFIKIEIENGKLSISGVIGPRHDGNAYGGCGQIDMEFLHPTCHQDDDDPRTTNPIRPDEIVFSEEWDKNKWGHLLNVWSKWHLNDLRAGCEHQEQEKWNKIKLDDSKPLTQDNMAIWKTPDEHPRGLLTSSCRYCGYKYGTSWRMEQLPQDVINFLESLPETKIKPAWV